MTALRASRAAGVVLAILGASAVGLGAFGAHALRGALSPARMEIWHTAVQYHFWHTLAFALAVMMRSASVERRGQDERFLILAIRMNAETTASWLFAVGVVLFCGSLYALALGAPGWTGAITPLGGVCFILGWIALGLAMMRKTNL